VVIRKEGQPTIIAHENWRGQFSRGTYTSGAVSDCTGQTTACTQVNWPGYRTTAWHQRSGSGPDIRTWFGGLVEGMRDQSGKIYMRNRYYDPAATQFTQTDPIGLDGGLNAYAFAAGDPVSYWDPSGLACEKKSDDRLVCTDVGPGDYRTLRDFLGGDEGQSAYATFEEAGLTHWDSRSCRGGFTPSQCDRIADAQASLTLHSNAFCSALGVRSTKRFQSGRFGWRPYAGVDYFGMSTPFNPLGAFRITRLSPLAFNSGELANTIAHEEFHYQRPFATESRANSTGYACAGPI
jgi:RHS repeat-associated protein